MPHHDSLLICYQIITMDLHLRSWNELSSNKIYFFIYLFLVQMRSILIRREDDKMIAWVVSHTDSEEMFTFIPFAPHSKLVHPINFSCAIIFIVGLVMEFYYVKRWIEWRKKKYPRTIASCVTWFLILSWSLRPFQATTIFRYICYVRTATFALRVNKLMLR